MFYFFFFSSRRRHTRCSRDWSSDVCSSDLFAAYTRSTLRDSTARLIASITFRSARPSSPGVQTGLSSSTHALKWSISAAKRSEEHTSELQSRLHLVCRLLLEKKKTTKKRTT